MLILGCDPGASTGLVLARAEAGRLVEILDRATITRKKATAEGYARHVVKIRGWFYWSPVRPNTPAAGREEKPDTVAVEDPTTMPDHWHGEARGRKTSRGVGAKVGAAYGCLLGALATSPVTQDVPITAYPVRQWMTGLFGRAKREDIYRLLAAMARTLTPETLPEDQLAALGVAAWHAQQGRCK